MHERRPALDALASPQDPQIVDADVAAANIVVLTLQFQQAARSDSLSGRAFAPLGLLTSGHSPIGVLMPNARCANLRKPIAASHAACDRVRFWTAIGRQWTARPAARKPAPLLTCGRLCTVRTACHPYANYCTTPAIRPRPFPFIIFIRHDRPVPPAGSQHAPPALLIILFSEKNSGRPSRPSRPNC